MKAINIALELPPSWLLEAGRLNPLALTLPNPIDFRLPHTKVPHITLAMAVVDDTCIPNLIAQLKNTLAYGLQFELQAGMLYTKQEQPNLNSSPFDVSGIQVTASPILDTHNHPSEINPLLELHKIVYDLLYDIGIQSPSPSSIANWENEPPEDISTTLDLIQYYPEKGTFSSFFPHITLAIGKLLPGARWQAPTDIAQSIVLYHMGTWCTCHLLIESFPLKNPASIALKGF
jgi:hypothetical protein